MKIPAKIKYRTCMLALVAAVMLVPSQWNSAYAQTAISFSLTGTGTGSISSFSLTGNGTITPYGPTTIAVTGGSTSGSFGVTFVVTFGDGSTWSATSTPTVSKNAVSGTATITSGTGTFAGATGSFTYVTTFTVTANGLSFTCTGAGTITGNNYYFSHLAIGGGWQTTLTYINYSPQAITCVTTFYSNSGDLLPVPFSDETVSSRTDTLQPGQSIHDQTVASLTAPVTQGWAQAACGGPIQASLLYRFYQSGTPVGEASVNAETAPTTKFVTFAQTATGVAYANPSTTQSATITFTIISSTGSLLGTTTIPLGPLAHGSANLGPLLGLQSFTGFVEITSTIPVISLSLNAEAFPVFSSLPPGDLPSTTTLFTP
jgi:hypothetical protein